MIYVVKLCIFDLDGTLTNTIPAISHFGNTALKSYSFPAIEPEKYKSLVGNGRDVLIHRMLKCFNADTDENFDKVGKAYDHAYESDPLYKTKPYDGIPELLDTLKANGVKIAVLSNKPHNVAIDVVKMFFGDKFDAAYGQRKGITNKPAPDGALMLAKELGVSPSESAFIGDTYVDIETGKNSGMLTIGVLWGFRDRSELENAGAEHIVAIPAEIANTILK